MASRIETLTTVKKGKATVLEIQVTNDTMHNIVLPGQTVLGSLELIRSVTPLEVKLKENEDNKDNEVQSGTTEKICGQKKGYCPAKDTVDMLDTQRKGPEVNLDELTQEQRSVVREMLCEERSAFAVDDNDIGCIKDLEMEIHLTDKQPVQKNHTSIPRPLYPEVKHYLEDLLNKNFIRRSKSPYSSSVVCVRKKDGSMRLCVDYRALNKKTVQDRHPIPRIQETLDNLGGNSWFSTLDQGKAYHQGFVSPESQPLTAFVTP